MADQIDQAQEQDAAYLQAALERAAANRPSGPSLERCEDCGERIPERRRQAVQGCTRCISCQEAFENE